MLTFLGGFFRLSSRQRRAFLDARSYPREVNVAGLGEGLRLSNKDIVATRHVDGGFAPRRDASCMGKAGAAACRTTIHRSSSASA